MQLDLAWTFPRFSAAAMQCLSLSRDLSLSSEDRQLYSELSEIFERAACTPPRMLGELYSELRTTAPSAAIGAALAFIADVISEVAGKPTVRASLLTG